MTVSDRDDGHRRKFSRGVFGVSGETTVEINDAQNGEKLEQHMFLQPCA